MKDYKIKGIEMEAICVQMLTNMGWSVDPIDKHCTSPGPDLTIKTHSGLRGAVEVKVLEDFRFDDYQKTKSLFELLRSKAFPFMIFTNNSLFDIYIYGDFKRRYTSCPEPEDIEFLLEKYDQQ